MYCRPGLSLTFITFNQAFQDLYENAPAVLLIDECESLFETKNEGDDTGHTRKNVHNLFLQEMERVQKSKQLVFFIGSTNRYFFRLWLFVDTLSV